MLPQDNYRNPQRLKILVLGRLMRKESLGGLRSEKKKTFKASGIKIRRNTQGDERQSEKDLLIGIRFS